jgi:hypothetical protein
VGSSEEKKAGIALEEISLFSRASKIFSPYIWEGSFLSV